MLAAPEQTPATDAEAMCAALQLIYDRIPTVSCRRRCGEYCGPISFLPAEAINVRRRGYQLPTVVDPRPSHSQCTAFVSATDKPGKRLFGECAIYEARPLICRLYGAVKKLRCPEGCRPKRWLNGDEVQEILRTIYDLLPGESYHTHPLGMQLVDVVKQLSQDGVIPEGGYR